MMNKLQADKIFYNATVVSIDKAGTIYEDGAIVVIADKIAAVGKTKSILSEYSAAEMLDMKQKIIVPGFVNTHTHLAMTIFRGIADDIELMSWLNDFIFPAERKFINPETVTIGDKLAMIELIHGGTTCYNNMYYFSEDTAKTTIEAGMRGIVSEGIIKQAVANSKNVEEALSYTAKILDEYKNNDLIHAYVGMHAIYTSDSDMIINAKKLANEYGVAMHMHLSETKSEFDFAMQKYGKTPVQYLDSLGILDEKTVAAHCVWLTDKDIQIIADKGVGVAHNPECNMKISSGISPIPKLIQAGAKIGLGTDGAASNNNLNMIQEMHTMSLLHKVNTMNPTVLPAEEIVRIATIGGAKVLGKDKEIGSIEINKKADFIAIDTNYPHSSPMYNVYSTIVYALLGNEISDVIINGKTIMKDYKILTLDEDKIISDAKNFAKMLKKNL